MNYIEANNILEDLHKVSGLNGYEIKLIIRKNIDLLEKELNPLGEQQLEMNNIIADLTKERDDLFKSYSNKEKKLIEESLAEYEEKYEALNVKHKDALSKFNSESEEFNKYIQNKCEVNLIKIPHSKLIQYDGTISDENFNRIFKLIDETK